MASASASSFGIAIALQLRLRRPEPFVFRAAQYACRRTGATPRPPAMDGVRRGSPAGAHPPLSSSSRLSSRSNGEGEARLPEQKAGPLLDPADYAERIGMRVYPKGRRLPGEAPPL